MCILSDGEWARLEAALDGARSGTGRPFPDERRTVEAAVWRQRDGAKWRAVPPEPGPWWKAAQLHTRRSRLGVRARAFGRLRDAGRPDLGEVFLDGTDARAHQKAAGAKGGRAPTPPTARAAATAPRPARRATRAGSRPASRSPPGQTAELKAAPAPLALAALLGAIGRVVCDGSYSSGPWLAAIRALGAEPVVRANPTHRYAPAHDRAACAGATRSSTCGRASRDGAPSRRATTRPPPAASAASTSPPPSTGCLTGLSATLPR